MAQSNNSIQTSGGSGLAGLILSAAGAYTKTRGQQLSMQLDARAQEANARALERSAVDAAMAGEAAYGKQRLQASALKARQKQTYIASGVELNEGTPVNTLTTTDVMNEIDSQTIRQNAVNEVFGYRRSSMDQRAAAKSGRTIAGGLSPLSSAFSTLLTEGGTVAAKWLTKETKNDPNKKEAIDFAKIANSVSASKERIAKAVW